MDFLDKIDFTEQINNRNIKLKTIMSTKMN